MECCCCEAKATFEVDTVLVCGRHLAYVVKSHCKMGPHEAKVRVIEQALKDKQ